MSKKNKKTKLSNTGVLATNRKARHDYTILDTWECGLVLQGTEIKALREGKVSLVEAFATIDNGEVWLRNMHIPEYSRGHWTNHPPRRTRKLLLHRREIDSLIGKVERDGYTLIPTAMYWKGNKVKLELALAKGKQTHDKRASEKDREWARDKQRVMRRHNRDA